MEMTIGEFLRLADDKSDQAVLIAELERQLAVKTNENIQLKNTVKMLEVANTAAQLENIMLRNYITLSVEKIKAFLSRLKGIEHFAFLKAFLEFVLPNEHYQEQLLLVNEVMTPPDEHQTPTINIAHAEKVNGVGEHIDQVSIGDGAMMNHNLMKERES